MQRSGMRVLNARDMEVAARARRRGFTLIELLVALVIVGVIVAAVTLTAGSGERVLEEAARRAEARIALACERAALSGRDIGFSFIDSKLRFGYVEPREWRLIDDSPSDELRERELGDGVQLQASRDGVELAADVEEALQPQFACLASGELTPFELLLGRPGIAGYWRVRGEFDGTLKREWVDER
jgi:general secretion pathway protein H